MNHRNQFALSAALATLVTMTTPAIAGQIDVLPGPPPPSPPPPVAQTTQTTTTQTTQTTAPLPLSPLAPAATNEPIHPFPTPTFDRPPEAGGKREQPIEQRFLHGFRLGYGYVMDYDKPVKSLGDKSLAERTNMRAPHNFLLGYEGFYRMVGHSWLNVILVGNVIVAGLEQSQFYPTANTLLGFEFNNSFQVGVGADFAPLKDNIAHTIFAAGWTPRVGSFYTPLHAFFIPDVDGIHRMGVLTGVTW